MPLRPLPAPFRERQLQICTNVRALETGRPSCGRNGGIELRERLKAAAKAAGKKGEVMVIGTSCLGTCPAEGVTFGLIPDNRWGIMLPEDEPLLRAELLGTEPG